VYRQTHRGRVVSTDRLIEQHEHQTQGRGIVYRKTHVWCSCYSLSLSLHATSPLGMVFMLLSESVSTLPLSSNMNTKPRGEVLCTERLTGDGDCVQTDSQWRDIVSRQTHRGGVVCTDRLTGEG
jgi:hypothetical protein